VAASKSLYLTAKLEIAADVIILQNTKAVDNGNRPTGPADDIVQVGDKKEKGGC